MPKQCSVRHATSRRTIMYICSQCKHTGGREGRALASPLPQNTRALAAAGSALQVGELELELELELGVYLWTTCVLLSWP
jgi:hypothetical protein